MAAGAAVSVDVGTTYPTLRPSPSLVQAVCAHITRSASSGAAGMTSPSHWHAVPFILQPGRPANAVNESGAPYSRALGTTGPSNPTLSKRTVAADDSQYLMVAWLRTARLT